MKFIYGQESFLIEQEIQRAISDFDGEQIIYSNAEPLENIILDLSTNSLFGNKKIIIIKDHPELNSSKAHEDFIDAFKNIGNDEIIFSQSVEKINKKNDIITYLLKNAECQEFKKISSSDIIPAIKKVIKKRGGTIDNIALINLSVKLPEDLRIIIGEVDKLLLQNSHINSEMVEKSISEYVKNDYFALSNAIISNDKSEIIRAYNQKIIAGEDIMMIISQISLVLSTAISISSLKKIGLNNLDISQKLGMHIYRIKKSSELLVISSIEKIESLILSLAKLEENIKTGKSDPKTSMDIYLLSIIK